MENNIKISITGNHIWARQTGPDSVEVGDAPGRGSYDKDTHSAVSKVILADVLEFLESNCDETNDSYMEVIHELRRALEDK